MDIEGLVPPGMQQSGTDGAHNISAAQHLLLDTKELNLRHYCNGHQVRDQARHLGTKVDRVADTNLACLLSGMLRPTASWAHRFCKPIYDERRPGPAADHAVQYHCFPYLSPSLLTCVIFPQIFLGANRSVYQPTSQRVTKVP